MVDVLLELVMVMFDGCFFGQVLINVVKNVIEVVGVCVGDDLFVGKVVVVL